MPNNDLISRMALLNDLSYCAPELWQDEEYIKAKIMKQPAVDAVPVVRCKDCKYVHLTDDDECKYCDIISALTEALSCFNISRQTGTARMEKERMMYNG